MRFAPWRTRAVWSWSRMPLRHTAPQRGSARAGSLGDAAAFSFYPSKNLGALGDGGAICTERRRRRERLRRLRNLGQRHKGEHVEVGFNERLDGIQAAMLRVKLSQLERWNAARRELAALYRDRLPAGARPLAEDPRGHVRLPPLPGPSRRPRPGS